MPLECLTYIPQPVEPATVNLLLLVEPVYKPDVNIGVLNTHQYLQLICLTAAIDTRSGCLCTVTVSIHDTTVVQALGGCPQDE